VELHNLALLFIKKHEPVLIRELLVMRNDMAQIVHILAHHDVRVRVLFGEQMNIRMILRYVRRPYMRVSLLMHLDEISNLVS